MAHIMDVADFLDFAHFAYGVWLAKVFYINTHPALMRNARLRPFT
jgi:hypothetical protein